MKITANKIYAGISILAFCLALWCTVSWYFMDSRINQTLGILNSIHNLSNNDTTPPKIYLDSLDRLLINERFEKNSYIQLMDTQSNLIIGYVTLLFALFGIAGLTISNRLAQEIKEDYEKQKSEAKNQFRLYRIDQVRKYNDHSKKVLEFKKEFTELHYDLNKNISNLQILTAERFTNAINYGDAIEYMIDAIHRMGICFKLKGHYEDLKYILKHLSFLIDMLDKIKASNLKLYETINDDFSDALILKAKNATNIDDPKMVELSAKLVSLLAIMLKTK